jgi:hypothetical protein
MSSQGDLAGSQFASRFGSFHQRHIRHPWAACGIVSHTARHPSFHHNLPQLRLMLDCEQLIHKADIRTNYVNDNYIIRVTASTEKREKVNKTIKMQ